ncbi:hypothetical protein Ancab_007462 [Ancistrocladus abbreviatus]
MGSDSNGRKKGVLFTASLAASSYGGPMKIINNIFSSDLLFTLRKEEDAAEDSTESGEVGVSERHYALMERSNLSGMQVNGAKF